MMPRWEYFTKAINLRTLALYTKLTTLYTAWSKYKFAFGTATSWEVELVYL